MTGFVCPFCKGTLEHGKTTFTVDLGFGVVVVRQVPASVCTQCGADWIDDSEAGKIEDLVNEARKRGAQFEVVALAS